MIKAIVDCRWWIVAGLLFAASCDEKKIVAPPVLRVVPGTATVHGMVRLTGTSPKMAEIPNQPCHADVGPQQEETVIAGPRGELKNVVVYVKNLAGGDGSAQKPAVMDQVNCRYVPHVLAVQTNQPVVFRSSDPTMHNVHYNPDRNPAANFAMTRSGDERKTAFAAGEFIGVRCDVHPWMRGYVGVIDNPWFAVTGDDGTFDLTGLPNRPIMLVAWHELYGSIEKTIDLSSQNSVEASFEFK